MYKALEAVAQITMAPKVQAVHFRQAILENELADIARQG